jgi:large-conductance mechanosensitive channel
MCTKTLHVPVLVVSFEYQHLIHNAKPFVILAFTISMLLIHHVKNLGVPDSDTMIQLGFLEPQLQ